MRDVYNYRRRQGRDSFITEGEAVPAPPSTFNDVEHAACSACTSAKLEGNLPCACCDFVSTH